MALWLAESLLACGGFDARDQMPRDVRWWREGYASGVGSLMRRDDRRIGEADRQRRNPQRGGARHTALTPPAHPNPRSRTT